MRLGAGVDQPSRSRRLMPVARVSNQKRGIKLKSCRPRGTPRHPYNIPPGPTEYYLAGAVRLQNSVIKATKVTEFTIYPEDP